ncbi:uncharacterized protein N7482_001479 [Penicillium canariense]|uniref:Uncharacterized protein n=1 Tax=Penicillium canariense TaxID=189055 RepID=A0A9W9IFU4_9EURO|nr:uncharacterized protein N7482_001479 [Penicillium canariense]KAJ5175602.1 hypothetical protein N7482_001479 [Penicillium canariense]
MAPPVLCFGKKPHIEAPRTTDGPGLANGDELLGGVGRRHSRKEPKLHALTSEADHPNPAGWAR